MSTSGRILVYRGSYIPSRTSMVRVCLLPVCTRSPTCVVWKRAEEERDNKHNVDNILHSVLPGRICYNFDIELSIDTLR